MTKTFMVLLALCAIYHLIRIIMNLIFKNKFKAFSLILLLGSVTIFVLAFFYSIDDYIYIIIISALYFLTFILYLVNLIKERNTKIIIDTLKDTKKNDSADFFILFDKKDRIIDYSKTFEKLAKLTKDEMKKVNSFDLLFSLFDIERINDTLNEGSYLQTFVMRLNSVKYSKQPLSFTLYVNEGGQTIQYDFLVNKIYHKKTYLGMMISAYLNHSYETLQVKNLFDESIDLLEKQKKVLSYLMSLSDGIALYYDYQEKAFFATSAFIDYTKSKKQSYSLFEFENMIVDEDMDKYNEQIKSLNAIHLTRIKFHLKIDNEIYKAYEDAIYLTEEGRERVSIIHLVSSLDEHLNEDILSTSEIDELLNDLYTKDLSKVIEDAKNIEIIDVKEDAENE